MESKEKEVKVTMEAVVEEVKKSEQYQRHEAKPPQVSKKGKVIQYMSPEGRNAKVPRAEVFFNNIIVSAHNINAGKLVSTQLSERQVVVAAGANSVVKPGDWIMINVDMFPKETKPGKHDVGNVVIVHPPIHTIDDTKYLVITDRHILYKITK